MHTTSPSLLERLRGAADEKDWRRFVQIYTPLLFYWARGRGLDQPDAEDLVQDVFSAVLRKLPEFRYDPGRSFRCWLRTVALNKWRDRMRRATVEVRGAGSLELEAAKPESDERWDAEYRRHLVAQTLKLLEPEFQTATWRAFIGTAVEGRSPAEVAAELGLSRNAVYVARCRVTQRLRQELAGLLD